MTPGRVILPLLSPYFLHKTPRRISLGLLVYFMGILSSCTWIYGSLVRTEFTSNGSSPGPTCDTAASGVGLGGGSGSVPDPYRICTLTQWSKLAVDSKYWNQHFALYSDLDLSSLHASNFQQIGNPSIPFSGSIDGRGFALKNLNLDWAGSIYASLFGWVRDAKFQNLKLQNFQLRGAAASALIGSISGSQTEATNITLSQIALNATGPQGVAGLLVKSSQNDTIFKVSRLTANSLNFTVENGGNLGGIAAHAGDLVAEFIEIKDFSAKRGWTYLNYTGGAAGRIEGRLQISSSTLEVKSSSADGNGYFGGIVARIESSKPGSKLHQITQVKVSGEAYWLNYAGGLVGYFSDLSPETPDTLIVNKSSWSGFLFSSGSSGGLINTIESGSLEISESAVLGGPIYGSLSGAGGILYDAWTEVLSVSIVDSLVQSTYIACQAGCPNYSGGLIRQVSGVGTTTNIRRTYVASIVRDGSTPRCHSRGISGPLTSSDNYYDSTVCTAGDITTGVLARSTSSLQSGTGPANWSEEIWKFEAGKYPQLRY